MFPHVAGFSCHCKTGRMLPQYFQVNLTNAANPSPGGTLVARTGTRGSGREQDRLEYRDKRDGVDAKDAELGWRPAA